ncbi:hypothetical protein K438DRAFT_1980896 [Mycena galopus ATCC 62051]|nr:hypothetical protein K438DRAFT_1980896 [Mycena galopus ATCC 62051]
MPADVTACASVQPVSAWYPHPGVDGLKCLPAETLSVLTPVLVRVVANLCHGSGLGGAGPQAAPRCELAILGSSLHQRRQSKTWGQTASRALYTRIFISFLGMASLPSRQILTVGSPLLLATCCPSSSCTPSLCSLAALVRHAIHHIVRTLVSRWHTSPPPLLRPLCVAFARGASALPLQHILTPPRARLPRRTSVSGRSTVHTGPRSRPRPVLAHHAAASASLALAPHSRS